MRPSDIAELLVLAALWGASFLFMRVAAPVFGPVPLIALRVAIAAAVLVPVLAWRGGLGSLRGRGWAVALTGALNSALPFCLLAYATLHVTAGLASVLNATSPLWAAVVAWVWLGDRLDAGRVAGLVVGFAGVAFLSWGRGSPGADGGALPILAALGATLSYGVAASWVKQRLRGIDPLAVAAGSQLAAAAILAAPAAALWPEAPAPVRAWGAVLALGVVCTAVAYVLFYRLIARLGPARAITVTYLIPPFAIAWGGVFLGERLTGRAVVAAAIVLLGTALATGLVQLPAWRRSHAEPS